MTITTWYEIGEEDNKKERVY